MEIKNEAFKATLKDYYNLINKVELITAKQERFNDHFKAIKTVVSEINGEIEALKQARIKARTAAIKSFVLDDEGETIQEQIKASECDYCEGVKWLY